MCLPLPWGPGPGSVAGGRGPQGSCAGFSEQILPVKMGTREATPGGGLNNVSLARQASQGLLENPERARCPDPWERTGLISETEAGVLFGRRTGQGELSKGLPFSGGIVFHLTIMTFTLHSERSLRLREGGLS